LPHCEKATEPKDSVVAAPVINVTGVSRGIGRTIGEELQSRGAFE
jgi:hypothetical protein